MKYLFIILIFLFTGCNNLTLNLDNIKSIQYDNVNLIEEDFDIIKNDLSKIKFSCSNSSNIEGSLLKIITSSDIYEITMSNNYYMEFKNNNKYCLTKDNNVKEIYENLNNLKNKYNNNNFYTIEFTNNYVENENDEFIKIDKENNYLIINSSYELYNFSINEIRLSENIYEEINLIYNKDIISSDNIVIRKNDFTNIKISFTNKYNYTVNIIPYMENNVLKFKEEFIQKK